MSALLLLRPNGTQGEPYEPPAPYIPPGSSSPVLLPSLRVLLYVYTGAALTPWESLDISERCSAVTSSWGRTSRDSAVADPGTMSLDIDNSDGLLDPGNTGSYYGPKLRPRGPFATRVRVEHLFEGSYRPIGFGMLDRIDRRWGTAGKYSQSVISTVDHTSELARLVAPAGIVFPAQRASQRIAQVLNTPSRTGERYLDKGWPRFTHIPISSRVISEYVTDGSTSHWEIMSRAAFADDGLLFFEPNGRLRLHTGTYRGRRLSSFAFGDGATEVEVESDLTYRLSAEDVITEAAFTTADGAWTAATSERGDYLGPGGATSQGATETALADQYQVAARARSVYARDSTPKRGVEQISLDALAAIRDLTTHSPYRAAVTVSLSDKASLTRRPPGQASVLTETYFVERITHQIEIGETWKTTLALSPAPITGITGWRLGVSKLSLDAKLVSW